MNVDLMLSHHGRLRELTDIVVIWTDGRADKCTHARTSVLTYYVVEPS